MNVEKKIIKENEVAVSLMKKKGLKFQASKKEYNNGGFSESNIKKFETYKNNIIEDLNTLYENEEIEFCLVDDILSENTINKTISKETSKETFENTKGSNNTETEKLSEEIKTLKATIEEMNKAIAVLKSNNIENEISKLKVEIPDFINEMECNDILSIKANREHFKKFKRFALYNNINIGTLVNYLFYYAMEELTK